MLFFPLFGAGFEFSDSSSSAPLVTSMRSLKPSLTVLSRQESLSCVVRASRLRRSSSLKHMLKAWEATRRATLPSSSSPRPGPPTVRLSRRFLGVVGRNCESEDSDSGSLFLFFFFFGTEELEESDSGSAFFFFFPFALCDAAGSSAPSPQRSESEVQTAASPALPSVWGVVVCK